MFMRRNHGLTVVVSEGVHGGGGEVRPAAVACGGGQRVGGGGERRRAALLHDKGRHVEGGDEKICQRYMSGHKFAERGGDVLQIYVFMTDIHIIGLKIGLKRHQFVSL